jgi:Glycosyl hydrolases family 43
MHALLPRTRFLPDQPWPDDQGVHLNAHGAGVLFHEGVYYLYGEHKVAGPKGNTAQVGVRVYRSTDLCRWQNAGIALPVDETEGSDIERGCVIERPKVIYNARTRTFVMWFHLELKGQGYHAARAACAVADAPTGPFRFVRSLRPNAGVWPAGYTGERTPPTAAELDRPSREDVIAGVWCRRDVPGGQMARDMTLYVDDDNKAYLIASAEENLTLGIHELTEDYLDFTGDWTRALPGGHNEAPAVCKRGGTYFMLTSGCTGWDPNAARLSSAPTVMGPWTPRGNPCVGTNPRNGLGPDLTFGGQSTHIQAVAGKPGAFVAMFDVWRPNNPIDGGYIWLPIEWHDGLPVIRWRDEWGLNVFDN